MGCHTSMIGFFKDEAKLKKKGQVRIGKSSSEFLQETFLQKQENVANPPQTETHGANDSRTESPDILCNENCDNSCVSRPKTSLHRSMQEKATSSRKENVHFSAIVSCDIKDDRNQSNFRKQTDQEAALDSEHSRRKFSKCSLKLIDRIRSARKKNPPSVQPVSEQRPEKRAKSPGTEPVDYIEGRLSHLKPGLRSLKLFSKLVKHRNRTHSFLKKRTDKPGRNELFKHYNGMRKYKSASTGWKHGKNVNSMDINVSTVKVRRFPIQKVYEVGKILGYGAFGEVRLCYHRDTMRKVAVKIMKKDNHPFSKTGGKTDYSSIFYNEVHILSILKHPNIVAFEEAFEGKATLYAVIEYCDSGDLFNYLQKFIREKKKLLVRNSNKEKSNHILSTINTEISEKKSDSYNGPLVKRRTTESPISTPSKKPYCLAESHMIRLARSILEIIKYLHSQRYVHRDIKAQNFLFTSKPSAQFGKGKTTPMEHNTGVQPENTLSADSLHRSADDFVRVNYKTESFSLVKTDDSRSISMTSIAPKSRDMDEKKNDSTPPNPFRQKRIVLIDFGMTAFLPEGKYLTNLCGSPHYVAPEILEHHYGMEVDMWSFGIVLYLLIYGKYPFDNPDRNAILKKIRAYAVSFPHTSLGPSPLSLDLLKKCLTRDPSKRITATEALNHPWLAYEGVDLDEVYRYPLLLKSSSGSRDSQKPKLKT